MAVDELLRDMRDGVEQSPEAIAAFVSGVVDGSITRAQAAAWIAWAYARTLTDAETVALTEAMTTSGTVLDWGDGAEVWDKHSTGGVGDKTSLVVAPILIALGRRVPMLSGRGLGHTGGTLDKLESIAGFRTDLPLDAMRAQMDRLGGFLCGQTADLAPADRVLYALRDEIQAVPSIPLIVGSILSKKLAAGVRRLVLDVKTGSGAFMETDARAHALASALVDVSAAHGVRTTAYVTEMGRALGVAVGNALEVAECVEVLRGGGPPDLRALCLALAEDGGDEAETALDDGRALEVFARLIEAQGGDPRVVDDPSRLLGAGCARAEVVATQAGVVQQADAFDLGLASVRLGANRLRAGDAIDPGVGLWVHVDPGDTVEIGQPLVTLWHRDGRGLEAARALVASAVRVGDTPVTPAPLVHARLGA